MKEAFDEKYYEDIDVWKEFKAKDINYTVKPGQKPAFWERPPYILLAIEDIIIEDIILINSGCIDSELL